MPPQEKRNFIIGIVVVAIVILIALWWMLASIFGWSRPPLSATSTTTTKTSVVTNVPVTQLPQGFPTSTPKLSVVETDESFSVDNTTSTQAGQKYVSSMPLLQVFDLYEQYFSQTGWTLSNFVVGDVATVGAGFDATQGGNSVNVKLTVNPNNQAQTDVYITYTFPK